MHDTTPVLFVSTVAYQETMPTGTTLEKSFLSADDPWVVRFEEEVSFPQEVLDFTVESEPIPLEWEGSQSIPDRWSGDVGFATSAGTRVNFVEVELALPRNARFLPYPDLDEAYGLELVVTFGA